MIDKPADQITKADLESLVRDEVAELRSLEYKQALPGNNDEEKKEFLADVSSFANAAGGLLIYGVRERRDERGQPTGVPEALCGLADTNTDAAKGRLENLLRDGVAPRIPGVEFAVVPACGLGPALIVRVPRSWVGPHMVTLKRSSRFHSRHSAGKYQLDVAEIRSAFAASESLAERIRTFRAERLSRIVANEAPVRLPSGPKVVVHLFPASASDTRQQIDVRALGRRHDVGSLRPLNCAGFNRRYNADGFLTWSTHRGSDDAESYAQFFRSGAVESVSPELFYEANGEKGISSGLFEEEVIAFVRRALDTLRGTGVAPPIFVFVSLIGVAGYTLSRSTPIHRRERYGIDRDVLLLPDVVIEDAQADVARVLRPAFDGLWQACGYEESPSYDAAGAWQGRSR